MTYMCACMQVCEFNLSLFIAGQALKSVSYLFFYNPEFFKDLERTSCIIVCQKIPLKERMQMPDRQKDERSMKHHGFI